LFIDYFRVDLARIKFSKIFSYKKRRLNLNKPDSAIRINPRTVEKAAEAAYPKSDPQVKTASDKGDQKAIGGQITCGQKA